MKTGPVALTNVSVIEFLWVFLKFVRKKNRINLRKKKFYLNFQTMLMCKPNSIVLFFVFSVSTVIKAFFRKVLVLFFLIKIKLICKFIVFGKFFLKVNVQIDSPRCLQLYGNS